MSGEFIIKIINIQRNNGYNILKKLPEDLQIKIWKELYKNSLIKITPLIKKSWNYNKSESLKLLLAKTDDVGILQIGYTDIPYNLSEYYTPNCNNCKHYRFPCLNCHYYVYPNIEPSMWKHPLNSTPSLEFRWGKKLTFEDLTVLASG